jgi:uncharacterized protein YbjT (DUF2867 family)
LYGVPVVDGGYNRVQPVYCVDAAEAIYKSLSFDDARGSLYELGGPDALTCAPLSPPLLSPQTLLCTTVLSSLMQISSQM